MKGLLIRDRYAPVRSYLTKVQVATVLEETNGYKMIQPGQQIVKGTHSLFVDDLKNKQESHLKLEIVWGVIVKTSTDTGACYSERKCAEIVFRGRTMIEGGRLTILKDKMKALDQEH